MPALIAETLPPRPPQEIPPRLIMVTLAELVAKTVLFTEALTAVMPKPPRLTHPAPLSLAHTALSDPMAVDLREAGRVEAGADRLEIAVLLDESAAVLAHGDRVVETKGKDLGMPQAADVEADPAQGRHELAILEAVKFGDERPWAAGLGALVL